MFYRLKYFFTSKKRRELNSHEYKIQNLQDQINKTKDDLSLYKKLSHMKETMVIAKRANIFSLLSNGENEDILESKRKEARDKGFYFVHINIHGNEVWAKDEPIRCN